MTEALEDLAGGALAREQGSLHGRLMPVFERLLANIELWLACNIVDTDLSPRNPP